MNTDIIAIVTEMERRELRNLDTITDRRAWITAYYRLMDGNNGFPPTRHFDDTAYLQWLQLPLEQRL